MKKHVAIQALQTSVIGSVRAVGCVGLFVATACGSGGGASVATSAITTSTLAAATASLNADANQTTSADGNHAVDENQTLGMEHIFPLLHLLPHEAAMGLHCDPNAAPEQVSVCGEKLPGSAQATWSSCQMRPPHAGRDGRGEDFHAGMGMMPPPAWGNGANLGMNANAVAIGDPNAEAQDANGWHHRAPPASSGSLTITASVTPNANTTCDPNTSIVANRQAVFTVRMGDANGPTMILSGTNSETMLQTAAHAVPNGNITLDLNRTMMDAGGNVLNSTVIAGTLQLSADANAVDTNTMDANAMDANAMSHLGPHHPMAGRLVSGTLKVNSDTVVLTAVAHHPGCMWPTSGTVERTDASGVNHTLVFGAACGSATLDGTAITLPAHPHGPAGHHPAP